MKPFNPVHYTLLAVLLVVIARPMTSTAAPNSAPAVVDDHDSPDAHDSHDAHDDHAHASHADEVKLTPEAIRRQNITLQRASRRLLAPSIFCPGRVTFDAEAMAHVGVAVRGRIVQVNVRLGDNVKKGDELLVIESPELGQAQSEFLQKHSAIGVAEAAVEPAKQAYDRAKKLHEKSEGIALAEVQRREADLKAAEGNLITAKASLKAAGHALRLLGMTQEQINKLTDSDELDPTYAVRAPLAGQVVEREATLGELVPPDKESLLVIADLSKVWIVADVPELQLASVETGAAARAQVAASKETIEGTIGYVSPSLDPNTRTGRVRVVVPNADGKLRPGMFARVELISQGDATAEQVLAIPEDAVQTVEGKSVVFVPVQGEPNTFAARRVAIEKPIGGFVAVYQGLKEGEEFVATNSFLLKADLGKSGAAHEH